MAAFGQLIDAERDKQVLLLPVEQAPHLITTPADPVRPNRETFKAEGSLDANGTLVAQIEHTVLVTKGAPILLTKLAE